MELFDVFGSAFNPMLGQNDPTMERYIELETAYYCKECDRFFDKDGYELSRSFAIDNYIIEDKECFDCKNIGLKYI